ncbi:MAG: YbdK family carboxylate-amine ligase [Actinomycetota bacterium]|nr:YbdK family carboxylate-amine ligase [Actinomycetota bacterium]
MSPLTVGVEEELHIVSRKSGRLVSAAAAVLAGDHPVDLVGAIKGEMPLSQIEITTPVCTSLYDVDRSLSRLRAAASERAKQAGCFLVASGTPFSGSPIGQVVAATPRYERISENIRSLVDEHLTAAAHVHVGIADPDDGVAVVNSSRVWLPTLVSLTANSPYWFSRQTGFASWRTVHRWRWPISGPPPFSATTHAYFSRVERLVQSRALPDPSMVYWDVRLSLRHPTVEFRIADTPLTVPETSMLAGLVRALAQTVIESRRCGLNQADDIEPELLRAALYCAARDGLEASLPNPQNASLQISAAESVRLLIRYVAEALRAEDDYDRVVETAEMILADGVGATRQLRLVQCKTQVQAARAMADEMIRGCSD